MRIFFLRGLTQSTSNVYLGRWKNQPKYFFSAIHAASETFTCLFVFCVWWIKFNITATLYSLRLSTMECVGNNIEIIIHQTKSCCWFCDCVVVFFFGNVQNNFHAANCFLMLYAEFWCNYYVADAEFADRAFPLICYSSRAFKKRSLNHKWQILKSSYADCSCAWTFFEHFIKVLVKSDVHSKSIEINTF